MSLPVVLPALRRRLDYQSLRALRDRQRALGNSNHVIRELRFNGLLQARFRIRNGSDIGNGSNRRQHRFDCGCVGSQSAVALLGELTIERRAVIFLAVTLGLDRQRQRVVQRDLCAIDRDRNLSRRVGAVLRQAILSKGIQERRRSRNRRRIDFGPDRLLRSHIIRDLGRRALQVVVNRDRGLIQLEVDLQNGAAVCFDRAAPSIVLSLIKDVLRRFFRRLVIARHLNRSAGLGLTRCGQGIVLSVSAVGILIIELNGVIDVNGFPLGVHGVMLRSVTYKVFIGGNLRVIVRAVLIRDKEIGESCRSSIFFDAADPALELIAFACRSRRNVNSLVDPEILVFGNRSAGIVVIPIDVGQDLLILLNINSIDLNGVGIRIAFFRLSHDIAFSIHDFGVCHQHIEGIAGEDRFVKNKCSAIPLLDFPVAEDIIAIIRYGSANGYRVRIIRILVSVCAAAAIDCGAVIDFIDRVVNHFDAFSADEFAAPLGIQIQLADGGGPSGIDFRIGIKLAIGADCLFVDTVSIKAVGMRKAFVSVPADQIEIDPLAADVTDLLAVINVELFTLRSTSRVLDRVGSRVVCVEINFVLGDTPLGIERYVVRRHLAKGVWISGAEGIIVPAQEHIAIECRRSIISGGIDVRFVVDVTGRSKVGARRRSTRRRLVASYKDAVAICDIILIAGIAEVNILPIIANRPCICNRRPVTRGRIQSISIDGKSVIGFRWIPCTSISQGRLGNQISVRIAPGTGLCLLINIESLLGLIIR